MESNLPIRSYLFLLVIGMAVPLAGGMLYEIDRDRRDAIAAAKNSLRSLSGVMASSVGQRIAQARGTLERLSFRPLVQAVDEHQCDPAVKELHQLNPGFANLVYTTLDGRAVCSAIAQPSGKTVSVGHTSWFQKVVRERRFSVGEPHVGPISGRWVAVLSQPIVDDRGDMAGAIHLPLDIASLDPKFPDDSVPKGIRYGFFNTEGTLVWRNEDPEKLIGTKPDLATAKQIVAVGDGDFEGVGPDGIARYFSVTSVPDAGWVAFVGVPAEAIHAPARQRAVIGALGAGLGLLALLGLALLVARRIEAPITALAAATRAFRRGEVDVRANTDGPEEIASVGREFNAMVDARLLGEAELARYQDQLESQVAERTAELASKNERLESALEQLLHAQERIVQAEKLASLGALVAGVAHELNTPIGNARTVATALNEQAIAFRQALDQPMRRSKLDDFTRQVEDGTRLLDRNLGRAGDLIHSFKQVAIDQSTAERRRFELSMVVNDVVSTLRPGFRTLPHVIEVEVPPGIELDGYPGPLGQVVANLVDNAVVHGLDGKTAGKVRVTATPVGDKELHLVVSDDGNGIPSSIRDRIFDPFFTTRMGQGGSGLGLNIVHNIVTGLLGGNIRVDSQEGRGSSFLVSLPRVAPPTASAS